MIQFGTVASPSAAQSAAISETQARYGAFLRTSNPNTRGYAQWKQATSGNLTALQIGGSGPAPVGACEVGFFGAEVSNRSFNDLYRNSWSTDSI